MFSFGLTWSAYNWLLQEGVLNIFMIIASIQVVICALSIPMCKLIPTALKKSKLEYLLFHRYFRKEE